MPKISKFYFHDAVSPNTGTMRSDSPATRAGGVQGAGTEASGASTARDATDVIGASNPDTESSITAAATSGVQQRLGHRRFVSRPLAATTLVDTDGNWTLSYARSESNTAHSGRISMSCYGWRPKTGAEIGTGLLSISGTLMAATAETADSVVATWSAIPTDLQDGDILVFDFYSVFTQSMATAYTDQFAYDGTTEASITTCASFVSPPVPLELSQVGYRAQPFQVSFHRPNPAILVPQLDTQDSAPGPATYDPTRDSAYDQIVLGDLPAYGAYWKMNEKTGTTFQDRGPNDLDLGIIGPVVLNQYSGPDSGDPLGNGSPQYSPSGLATLASPVFHFPGQSSFSLEAWIYPLSEMSEIMSFDLFNLYSSGNGGFFFTLTGDTTNNILFVMEEGGGNQTIANSSSILEPFSWSHLIATYNGVDQNVYLNSVPVGTIASTISLPESTNLTLKVGSSFLTNCYMAKAAVYGGTALTQAQVTEHFLAGTASTWSPDLLPPGMRLPIGLPGRRTLPQKYFDQTIPTFPVAQTFSVFFEAIQALTDTSSEPYEAVQALADTSLEPYESIIGGIQQTKSDPFEANLGIKQTDIDPYDALGGIAGTKSDPLEALQSIAATKSDPWEALLAITKTISDAWEANQGIAGTKSDPWEALQSLVSTKAASWEALVALTTTKIESWEALVAIIKTNSEAWEGLTAITSTKSEAWEALRGIVSTKSEAWEALVGIAKTNSESWEALQGIAKTNSDVWEALQKLAATGLTPWEAIVGGVFATRVNSWESLLGIKQTDAESYDALQGITATKSDVWETVGAVRTSLILPWEAIVGGIVSTRSNPWEANVSIASNKADVWEALLGIASTKSDPWESQGNVLITQTASLPWDALKAIASTSNEPLESIIGGITSTRSEAYEALLGIASNKAEVYESLKSIVSLGISPWDATGIVYIPVSATRVLPYDTLTGIRVIPSLPLEASKNLTKAALGPYEARIKVFNSATLSYETVVALRNPALLPLEVVIAAISQIGILPWEAGGRAKIIVTETGLELDGIYHSPNFERVIVPAGGSFVILAVPSELMEGLTETGLDIGET